MVKTPEQYFQDQNFDLPKGQDDSSLSSAEQAFLKKYVGVEGAKSLGIDVNTPHIFDNEQGQGSLDDELKTYNTIQLIFFYVQNQLYTIPIDSVQEVIKSVPSMRLPMAPPFVKGVINLRGRITPLIELEDLVCVNKSENAQESFIIICQRKGMQVGIIIDKIQTMHTVQQHNISWNVEAHIGTHADCLCGILDYNNRIFGILSIDKIVNHIIEFEG